MGVWIETDLIENSALHTLSHPVWVCGLKLNTIIIILKSNESHPVWVCGLKPESFMTLEEKLKSHPVWVCGLKLNLLINNSKWRFVTPCMGVWIETLRQGRHD